MIIFIAAVLIVALAFGIPASKASSKLTTASDLGPLKPFEDRAQTVSDSVPARIRAKVAYKKMLETEAWMISDKKESDVPFDKSEFVFEGVRYNPEIDFK